MEGQGQGLLLDCAEGPAGLEAKTQGSLCSAQVKRCAIHTFSLPGQPLGLEIANRKSVALIHLSTPESLEN